MHIICVVHVCVYCLLYVVCTLHVCVAVCCVTRSTHSTLDIDMALLSVSQLTCGTCMVHRIEYCVDIVLTDSAHCV